MDFSLISGHLYKMGPDEILCRYILEHEKHGIFVDIHGGVAGGHYARKETAQKILSAGLWWAMVHKDSKDYCSACDVIQRTRRPSWRDEFPLNPQVTLQDFDKWELDFVGTMNPTSKNMGARDIITVTNYMTMWDDAKW